MGRPKSSEETKPLHTRLTTSQREGFDEYVRREQAKMPRGALLTEAAVLRGMILRCLDLEGIAYVGAQQTLFSSPRAPVEEPPPVVEEPAPPPPPPPPPPVVEEPTPPSSPAEKTSKANKARTAIGVAAEPVKTSAKKTKSATTSTAPAKKTKAEPVKTSAKKTKSAPAKKTKKGAR